MKLLGKLRLVKAFAQVARDPRRLDQVFALADAGLSDDVIENILTSVRAHEQGRAALRDRPRLDTPPLETLARLPHGTLGQAYAAHARRNGIDPHKLPRRDTPDERSYFLPHLIETHDVWHVVAGFDTDVAGELGLMSFYAAQSPGKVPVLIIIAGLVATARTGMHDKDRRFEAIATGWRRGRSAKPLFGARWSEMWAMPLASVREQFNVTVEESRAVEERPDQQQPPPHLSLPQA